MSGTSETQHEEEDPYGIRASRALMATGTRVLKHGETFAVFDRSGDVPGAELGTFGLFHEGTRFLSWLGLRVAGRPSLLLSSAVSDENILGIDLTNGDVWTEGHLAIPHGTVHVMRTKFLWNAACYERLEVTNFGSRPIELEIDLDFGADFVDLFEVRGVGRSRRGQRFPATVEPSAVELAYGGLDGVRRSTRIELTPAPTRIGPNACTYRLSLAPQQSADLELRIACRIDETPPRAVAFGRARSDVLASMVEFRNAAYGIRSSNAHFDAWLHRAVADLRLMVTRTRHGPYPYAGVPWFSTPFGRDGILTAMLALRMQPDLAAGVLRFLAANQADRVDDASDAEPGKILHELRSGEMAALREIPFGRYYGSADSSPLFVMLVADHFGETGDLALVRELWPHVERALEWIERWGDVDGDGFVEYGRRSHTGLVHQGWKDSHDAISHADGSEPEGPIAVAEVQGYVYAAWRAAAALSHVLGDAAGAARWTAKAAELQRRFDESFWCDDISMYALALDGHKRPCAVRSSNAAHCLFSGIALPHRAEVVADQLLQPDMFSGWGIRTLSSRESRYNPIAYHNGSVWPHDNAIAAMGLSRYGFKGHASKVLEGLFEASQLIELHRMPELFCGFPRRLGEGPTLYPVACSPQSWAAAAAFGLLESVLGLSVRADPPQVSFHRPLLPQFLDEIVISNLRVGRDRVSVRLHRYADDVGVHVHERSGPVEIVIVK